MQLAEHHKKACPDHRVWFDDDGPILPMDRVEQEELVGGYS